MPDEIQKQSSSFFTAENCTHETPLESPRKAFVTLYDGLLYRLIVASSVPTRIIKPLSVSLASIHATCEGTDMTSNGIFGALDAAVVGPMVPGLASASAPLLSNN